MTADVPRGRSVSTHHVVVLVLVAGAFAAILVLTGYWTGWVRGHEEATALQERGWNQIARTVDGRRTDADLERLLGRPVTEGCYETLYERDRPVPLLLAVERARRETRCMTQAFNAGTERARRAPRRLEDLVPKRGLTLEDIFSE